MPRITRPQVYRVVSKMLPRERFGPNELLRWLEETQECNERAGAPMPSAEPPGAPMPSAEPPGPRGLHGQPSKDGEHPGGG